MQLIVFANAVDMNAIALEGLIAYRIDVKQLFYRDNVTWRPIRVSSVTSLSVINSRIFYDAYGRRRLSKASISQGIFERRSETVE